jgi:tetratricopeptide (TPR) repeat protein
MNARGIGTVAALAVAVIATPVQAQNFGASKTTVKLQRKLPALYHLPGKTIRVRVTAHGDQADLAIDLQGQLLTELMKNDSQLQEDENDPSVTVTCQVTSYAHPKPTQRTQPGIGKQAPQVITRITGSLDVAFQAKAKDGRTLGSDNVQVNYDQEFDAAGNNVSHGVMGSLANSWHRLRGTSGTDSEDTKPPTDAELRSLLLDSAVHRIAQDIVNTNETIEVFLAKDKGAIDDGDKLAVAGLWQRALETYETAKPLSKLEDDAYRLYDIGVANEALGYQAEDPKAAMKFLDEAAINYGKAIDAKPGEKYFLGPQRRIETAIAHYRKLEEAKNAPPPAPTPPPPAPAVASAPTDKKPVTKPARVSTPSPAPKPAVAHSGGVTGGGSHALTDTQVIAMVKNGIDDDTVTQAVRNAKAVDFDLSSAGQRRLAAAGVTPAVLSAMKARAAQELAK